MRKYLPYLILVLFVVVLLGLIYIPKDRNSTQERLFSVKSGESSRDIAMNLQKQGLINWSSAFRLYVLFTAKADKLQAGTYLFSPSMDNSEIAQKLAAGKTAKINLIVPEGFTAEQIYQRIAGITEVNLADLESNQGYLFPDTYEISYGVASQEIVKLMRDNFDKKIADLKITPEIIIMASILEKEVKTKADKELVAGILWKRLKIGMALQVDSAPETYQRRGLPGVPICNPGLESIASSIYPKSSDYWYYLSTPEGKTIFSKTFEEHNLNRAKYLDR